MMAKPLQLRGGAQLHLRVSPQVRGRFLLKIVVELPHKGARVEQEIDRKSCEDEAELWVAIQEFASSRLCDLADIADQKEYGDDRAKRRRTRQRAP